MKTTKRHIATKLKRMQSYIAVIVIALLISSCEESDTFVPDAPRGDIENFFAEVPQNPQNFNLDLRNQDPLAKQYIVTENEVVIFIPGEDILVDSDGAIVEGEVAVTVEEYDSKAEYILNRLPSVLSNGRILETTGILNLVIEQNGEQLQINPESPLTIEISYPFGPGRPRGDVELMGPSNNTSEFTWDRFENNGTQEFPIEAGNWNFTIDKETMVSGSGYVFNYAQLGLLGINRELITTDSRTTEVCVALPSKYTSDNSIVFMAFQSTNAVLILTADAGSQLFCDKFATAIIGQNAVIGVISEQGANRFELGIKEIVIEENLTVTLSPEEAEFSTILERLNGL